MQYLIPRVTTFSKQLVIQEIYCVHLSIRTQLTFMTRLLLTARVNFGIVTYCTMIFCQRRIGSYRKNSITSNSPLPKNQKLTMCELFSEYIFVGYNYNLPDIMQSLPPKRIKMFPPDIKISGWVSYTYVVHVHRVPSIWTSCTQYMDLVYIVYEPRVHSL